MNIYFWKPLTPPLARRLYGEGFFALYLIRGGDPVSIRLSCHPHSLISNLRATFHSQFRHWIGNVSIMILLWSWTCADSKPNSHWWISDTIQCIFHTKTITFSFLSNKYKFYHSAYDTEYDFCTGSLRFFPLISGSFWYFSALHPLNSARKPGLDTVGYHLVVFIYTIAAKKMAQS